MIKNINTAYIAFGANLSNPRETFFHVIEALGLIGIEIDAVSSLWRSPAWPAGSGAPDYTNAAIRVRTCLNAPELMQTLLRIETMLGRRRTVRNAPRSCDLDLIDYAGQVSNDRDCTLPHPRMQDRDFVLLPMEEVIEDGWVHPASKLSVRAMLDAL